MSDFSVNTITYRSWSRILSHITLSTLQATIFIGLSCIKQLKCCNTMTATWLNPMNKVQTVLRTMQLIRGKLKPYQQKVLIAPFVTKTTMTLALLLHHGAQLGQPISTLPPHQQQLLNWLLHHLLSSQTRLVQLLLWTKTPCMTLTKHALSLLHLAWWDKLIWVLTQLPQRHKASLGHSRTSYVRMANTLKQGESKHLILTKSHISHSLLRLTSRDWRPLDKLAVINLKDVQKPDTRLSQTTIHLWVDNSLLLTSSSPGQTSLHDVSSSPHTNLSNLTQMSELLNNHKHNSSVKVTNFRASHWKTPRQLLLTRVNIRVLRSLEHANRVLTTWWTAFHQTQLILSITNLTLIYGQSAPKLRQSAI